MAKFNFDGLDTISASIKQLSELTDEEKFSVIRPAGQLLKEKYVEKIQSLFTQRSSSLAKSVSLSERYVDGNPAINISLKGKHPGSGTGKRKGKRGSNGKYSGTNAEVGYILEYGSPRIPARHWMEGTNEEQADAVVASQEERWDALLKSKGL